MTQCALSWICCLKLHELLQQHQQQQRINFSFSNHCEKCICNLRKAFAIYGRKKQHQKHMVLYLFWPQPKRLFNPYYDCSSSDIRREWHHNARKGFDKQRLQMFPSYFLMTAFLAKEPANAKRSDKQSKIIGMSLLFLYTFRRKNAVVCSRKQMTKRESFKKHMRYSESYHVHGC